MLGKLSGQTGHLWSELPDSQVISLAPALLGRPSCMHQAQMKIAIVNSEQAQRVATGSIDLLFSCEKIMH